MMYFTNILPKFCPYLMYLTRHVLIDFNTHMTIIFKMNMILII